MCHVLALLAFARKFMFHKLIWLYILRVYNMILNWLSKNWTGWCDTKMTFMSTWKLSLSLTLPRTLTKLIFSSKLQVKLNYITCFFSHVGTQFSLIILSVCMSAFFWRVVFVVEKSKRKQDPCDLIFTQRWHSILIDWMEWLLFFMVGFWFNLRCRRRFVVVIFISFLF